MYAALRKRSALLLVLPLSAFAAAESLAQAPGATVEIVVRSAENLQPLSGARVIVEGVGIHAMTDENGFVSIADLPAGTRRIEVRYLGYETTTEYVSVVPGRTARAELRMQIQPIELTEVTVRARSDVLAIRGFYDRQKGGLGTFLTRAEITESSPRYMSDILRRVSGIQVGSSTLRPTASIRGPGRACPIQYFLDGALTAQFNIDEVMPGDVEGLEIYRGASTVPPMYNKGTSTCGVILIWTRVE